MTTTGRQDVVDGLVAVLEAFQAANPTLLRKVYSRRPGSFDGEKPVAFVGNRDELILHTSGTRQRTFAPTVVIVDVFGDNEQSAGRMDALVDGLVDTFTANPHAIDGAVLSQTAVLDIEIEQPKADGGSIHYPATTLVFGEIVLMEGRS